MAQSHVLHGVDFDVPAGEVVTLLGRNGAGKTTTLRAIMGVLGRRAGSVRFEGSETDRPAVAAHRAARHRLLPGGARHLREPERRGEPASAARRAAGRPVRSTRSSTCFPNLRERLPARARSCRAASSRCWPSPASCAPAPACCCSTSRPKGLAPVIVQQIGRTIARLKRDGFTVLLVEQNFRFAATVADRHYVVEQGRVIDTIPNAELGGNVDKLHALPRRLSGSAPPRCGDQGGAIDARSRMIALAAALRRRRRRPRRSAEIAVKVGVLNDRSGIYADFGGEGSVIAAQMAVEDFKAADKGIKVDIVSADHQNKPDIGSNIARQWYDQDGVDADPRRADLLGRARRVPGHAREEQGVHRLGRRRVRHHRQAMLAQHHPLDLRHLRARQGHGGRHGQDRRQELVLPHRRLRLRPCARDATPPPSSQAAGGTVVGTSTCRSRPPTSPPSCSRRRAPRPMWSASPMRAATRSTPSSRRPNSASPQGGQKLAGLLVFLSDVHALGPPGGAGPDADRSLLLGPERRHARLVEALRGARRRQDADHGPRRRLCRACCTTSRPSTR